MTERISVIIPHLNQPDGLATCLRSLAQQLDVAADVEVLVVDNGSVPRPDAVVAEHDGVRLLREDEPGPGPARNRGVDASTGDVLAFIDADCIAHPGWLAAIEREFEDPATAVIGGDVRVAYADPEAPTFVEPYEAIYSYRNEQHIAEGFSGTGNLAVRRDVMDDVGPFGGVDIAEDREWGLRAGGRGHEVRYVPSMIIHHPARASFGELRRKWDRHMAHDLVRYRGRPLGTLRWLLRAVAVAGSPVAEVVTLVRSDRVGSVRERLLAAACLVLLRLYRAAVMVRLVVTDDGARISRGWNRG